MKKIISVWIIQTTALIIVAYFSDNVEIKRISSAVVAVGLIGLFNAFVRPALIRITLPITLITLGLFSLVINGLLIYLASLFLPGFTVATLGTAIWVSVAMAILNTLISHLFSVDDSGVYFRNVTKKQAKKFTKVKKTKKPGVIFLEIDGLAKPVLIGALRNGYMPTLARWLRESHNLVGWECDLSSQTAASQSGILEGNNKGIPAFRWLDKKTGKIIAASQPKDVAALESELSSGKGLLVHNGASLNNMFSGDAKEFTLTISKLAGKPSFKGKHLTYFFLGPYNMIRTFSLAIVDIAREMLDFWYQKRNDIRPRISRGFKFSLIRAATTVVARDLGVFTLMGYMFEGVPSVYTTFVGYDEVAHHAGIERSEAMRTLTQLDKQFERVEDAAKDAPRPYHLVVLSDHGQSQGATFKQRYDMTLEQLVEGLLEEDQFVHKIDNTDEGWGHINAMVTGAAKEDGTTSKVIKTATRGKSKNGVVIIGPESKIPTKIDKKSEVTVLASGNLGLVYFNRHKKRITYEQINKQYPKLLDGLSNHEGIGFVMVRSKKGPIAIGAKGTYDLKSDKIVGEDPIANFGPNTKRHLLREDKFDNCPDILINGFYNKETEEGGAFEELVGFHGGLGGPQTQPFILHPKVLKIPKGDIVGAEAVHKILKSWAKRAD